MKKRKVRAKSVFAPVLQSVLISIVTYVLLLVLLLLGITPEQHDIRVGLPAGMDIMATKDVKDTVTTEMNRELAAAAVEPSYKSADSGVSAEVMSDIEARFSALSAALQGAAESGRRVSEESVESLNATLGMEFTPEQYAAMLDADPKLLRQLFEDTDKLVRDLMNNTLLEGQEASAVASIARTLASSGYPQPLVAVAAEIMRGSIQPNMLIDEEATEANREKAREAVETVTCVKGEVIVRRGEIVTNAQYQMLSSLGLLKEDHLDLQLIAGIALIILLIMGSVALYLLRYRPNLLKPKPLCVLCVVFVLVVLLSLAISQWSAYLMPVSLGVLLLSLLIDHRAALYINLALGLTVSLLAGASNGLFTVAMFSVAMMSLISGPVALLVFSRSMQRTTALVAGVLIGLSNFLVTLGVGLINSAEIYLVLTNACWALASGLLSAVLCLGFQPLFEWTFNLATTAKLIELSNPNQPILRRLLLEAPGTYHHSIIVANLAEAAATAVGGNGLLARVGAYYHDIGKLKRPMYFKENQMGDNPHDRTDPRVSAAILTAHPRDGEAMAQKARLPEPVLEIIRQHHGDGVVLWFYDKAVKLYGADQVDISAFRYDGPRPHSREAAVVMLADSIEAAVRSIPDPNPEKVDALIRKLVRVKLDDGQLDRSELTFSDLEKICSAFSTVLTGVFHERIEYPDVSIPPRSESREAAEAQKSAAHPRPQVPHPAPAKEEPKAAPTAPARAAPAQATPAPAAPVHAAPAAATSAPTAPTPAVTTPAVTAPAATSAGAIREASDDGH
ncbi:MAG: HDIG domain-containing protein [Clostridia bacterium]|nr:HDIG domain-containing protein [Clostridia bacterium]